MPSIIVACAGLGCAVQALLDRIAYEVLIFFQVEHRLFPDAGEQTVFAGLRAGAVFAGQNLAADGKIDVLYATNEPCPSFQVFLFDCS